MRGKVKQRIEGKGRQEFVSVSGVGKRKSVQEDGEIEDEKKGLREAAMWLCGAFNRAGRL